MNEYHLTLSVIAFFDDIVYFAIFSITGIFWNILELFKIPGTFYRKNF